MTQESHVWAYNAKNSRQDLDEVCAHLCALQRHSQRPRGGGDPNVPTDTWVKKAGHIHTIEYYATLKTRHPVTCDDTDEP